MPSLSPERELVLLLLLFLFCLLLAVVVGVCIFYFCKNFCHNYELPREIFLKKTEKIAMILKKTSLAVKPIYFMQRPPKRGLPRPAPVLSSGEGRPKAQARDGPRFLRAHREHRRVGLARHCRYFHSHSCKQQKFTRFALTPKGVFLAPKYNTRSVWKQITLMS